MPENQETIDVRGSEAQEAPSMREVQYPYTQQVNPLKNGTGVPFIDQSLSLIKALKWPSAQEDHITPKFQDSFKADEFLKKFQGVKLPDLVGKAMQDTMQAGQDSKNPLMKIPAQAKNQQAMQGWKNASDYLSQSMIGSGSKILKQMISVASGDNEYGAEEPEVKRSEKKASGEKAAEQQAAKRMALDMAASYQAWGQSPELQGWSKSMFSNMGMKAGRDMVKIAAERALAKDFGDEQDPSSQATIAGMAENLSNHLAQQYFQDQENIIKQALLELHRSGNLESVTGQFIQNPDKFLSEITQTKPALRDLLAIKVSIHAIINGLEDEQGNKVTQPKVLQNASSVIRLLNVTETLINSGQYTDHQHDLQGFQNIAKNQQAAFNKRIQEENDWKETAKMAGEELFKTYRPMIDVLRADDYLATVIRALIMRKPIIPALKNPKSVSPQWKALDAYWESPIVNKLLRLRNPVVTLAVLEGGFLPSALGYVGDYFTDPATWLIPRIFRDTKIAMELKGVASGFREEFKQSVGDMVRAAIKKGDRSLFEKALNNRMQGATAEFIQTVGNAQFGFVRMSGMFSPLEAALVKIPNRASPQQILNTFTGAGVSAEEIADMALPVWLAGKQMVEKKALMNYLEGNEIKVTEVTKGGQPSTMEWVKNEDGDFETPDSQFTLRLIDTRRGRQYELVDQDGEELSDNLFATREEASQYILESEVGDMVSKTDGTKFQQYQLPGGTNYREVLLTLPQKEIVSAKDAMHGTAIKESGFQSSHWDEPNVLAHLRLNDRVIDGKKTLFVEEIQSDWHQKGREQGYAQEPKIDEKAIQDTMEEFGGTREEAIQLIRESEFTDAGKVVPDAPFKKTWHELAMKRVLKMAVDEGYEKVAWTTGEQQAERYDLSKQISKVELEKSSGGAYAPKEGEFKSGLLKAYDKSGKKVISQYVNDPSELPGIIGKDASEKLIQAKEVSGSSAGLGTLTRTISGQDLKVGGEGMKGFYDQMIPQFLNKYTKKWGGRVVEGEFAEKRTADFRIPKDQWKGKSDVYKVHTLDITPFMAKALKQGQAVYGLQGKTPKEGGFARVSGEGETPEKLTDEERIQMGIMKPRKFVESAKEAPVVSPEVKKVIEGNYSPITNKETMTEAVLKINKNGMEASLAEVLGAAEFNALHVGMGTELIRLYQNKGDFDTAAKIVERLAEKATTSGQAVQALSIVGRLSPEGVLLYAQRTINRANLEAQTAGLKGEAKLTDAIRKSLVEEAKYLSDLPEGREKVISAAKIQSMIESQIPSSAWAKVSLIQTMAMLLNPKTIIRNLVGNVGFSVLENVSQTAGAAFDMAVKGFTGIRTKEMPQYKAWVDGMIKGTKEGVQDALYGIDTSRGSAGKFDFVKKRIFQKKGWETPFHHLENTLSMVLRAPDRAFYQSAYDASLAEQMKAGKVNFPTEDMVETAHLDGLYKTFQDDSAMSRVFKGIKRAFNHAGFGTGKDRWGMGDLVLKFPGTPANILQRGIEYTPANFFNTIWQLAKMSPLKEKLPGELRGTAFHQRKAAESFGRGLTGSTLLIGTGIILARMGIITGASDKDKDVNALQKEVGLGAHKINTSALTRFIVSGFNPESLSQEEGDNYLAYDWFQPQSIGLAIGANIAVNKGKGSVSSIIDAATSASQTLVDQPLLGSLRKLFGFNDPIAGISKLVQGLPASFVPTFVSQISRLVDNTSRNTYDDDFFKGMWKSVAYKIPYLSKTLEPRITVWGEDQLASKNKGKLGRFFETFVSPAYSSNLERSPEAKMALDIWMTTGIKTHFPRIASKRMTINGEKITLDDKTYVEFQRYIGHKTGVMYNLYANNEAFKLIPKEEQAKRITSQLEKIVDDAKVLYLGKKKSKRKKNPFALSNPMKYKR